MRSLARSVLLLFAFSSTSLCVLAQSAQKTGTGVVTGRVMVAGKPAPGVTVSAMPGDIPDRREATARATTDYEGNYRLTGLPAGRYTVTPMTPTLVAQSENAFGGAGRFVIVGEGETVDKIDFTLARAGVITGRITDADGRPVIEERIHLTPADNANRGRYGSFYNPFMYQTDDRGVYRLYGIPPGRYTVGIGIAPEEGMVRVGTVSRGYYTRTYYPGETDIKKAGIIEVTEGAEVKDIDIKLGRPAASFAVSGRVTDADTGRPVPNMMIGYGSYELREKKMMSYGFGQTRTDARGLFRLEGVVPGRFAVFVWSEDETYSDPIPFEVTDADVGGLELRLRRGASLSGIAQIEGASDKSVLARLSQLTLGVIVQGGSLGPPDNRRANINPDGTFRITGLPPGKASLFIFGYPPPKDIKLARVERDGSVVPQGGIEIPLAGEVGNLRVVFEYGSGSIRGQVRVEGGTLPEGSRTFALINRVGDEPNARPAGASQVDARGRFMVEGLAAGEYQITVRVQFPPGMSQRPITAKQSVTVANGVETEATIPLDLGEKATEGKEQ